MANVHAEAKSMHKDDYTEQYFKHSILHSLRSHKVRFEKTYGELVLCIDCAPYWRKNVQAEYKANRKKPKDKKIDWEMIYTWVNNLVDEMDDIFPFKVIRVKYAEADDTIASLARKYHTRENILVVSNDKDLLQLQRYKNVKQYAPVKKEFISSEHTIRDLAEKVLRGDAGDGIPSIKCASNHFVNEDSGRAKPMKKAEVELWRTLNGRALMNALPPEYHQNYIRNKKLIDLNFAPDYITQGAIDAFEDDESKYDMMKLVAYFSKHKMRRMLEYVEDFK